MDKMQNSITYRKQQHSPLFCLPAELRNKIYEYAIGGHNIQVECRVTEGWSETRVFRIKEAALRLTCHQIRSEIGPYLAYSVNTFGGCDRCLSYHIDSAYQPGLQYITAVEIQPPWDPEVDKHMIRRLAALQTLKSLKHIAIVMPLDLIEKTQGHLAKINEAFEKDRKTTQAVSIAFTRGSQET